MPGPSSVTLSRDLITLAGGGEGDGRRPVLGGVLHEIPERAPQQGLVREQSDLGASGHGDGHSVRQRMAPGPLGDLAKKVPCVHLTQMRGKTGRLEASSGQHVVDQSIELGEIAFHVTKPDGVVAGAGQELQGQTKTGQG